ncbi:Placenta-expressed transcript 1 protein [Camelus dromedarius]|uniref:Placenta-expressed transcript 1 protein n=1 Tax=Camelus dromedarius TaxID=9838 RepID=A0A5N4C865_CAMDR|nr:Placenta-expressed transcript 1 protein [Camelus dromedarius]
MAVLGSPLLPLVLSLCLGLLFPSAKCQYPIGKCVTISKIIGAADGGIQANPDIYENDTMYTEEEFAGEEDEQELNGISDGAEEGCVGQTIGCGLGCG